MKIALISDTHFGVRKNSEIFLESHLRFFKEQFIPYLENNDIKNVFFLGDICDNRSSMNIKIMNAVYDLFQNTLKDFKVNVLIGNHDTYFNSSIEINSLKFLDNLPNVNIIEKITTIEIDNKKIVMVPWIVNYDEFIKEFKNIKCDLCFGHFDIQGFNFNKFKTSEGGISANIFGKCGKVFTGHFHIRNSRIYQNNEIIYIGSPFQLNRNDIDERRGFTIVDTETNKYQFIDNNVSLKYISVKYPQSFENIQIKNNIVDVHIDYDDSYNENEIQKYLKKIEELNPICTPNIIIDNTVIDGEIDLNEYDISSVTELMKEYVDILEIKNKNEIYENLLNLYNEIKSDIL